MPATNPTTAVAAYFAELRRIQASGGATGERSAYGALTDLLNAVGDTLRPKVFCVPNSPTRAPAIPTSDSTPRARLNAAPVNANPSSNAKRRGQLPERGVVEVKPAADDAWLTADGEQVSRYWQRYRQVLVTNTRDFVMVGEDANGRARPSGNLPPGRFRRRFQRSPGASSRLRQRGRRRPGRIPVPRPVQRRVAGRTERPGLAAGVIRSRRTGPRGTGRRSRVAGRRPGRVGGVAGRAL